MPRQHFIIQREPQGVIDANGVENQAGPCCGAVCLTYLLGEVIDAGYLNLANEHNIFVNCREKTRMGAPTNPFRIQCYLSGNEYSAQVQHLFVGKNFNVVPKIWEDSESQNALNEKYGFAMRIDAENAFSNVYRNISRTSPMAGNALTMADNSFFLGVFKDKSCVSALPEKAEELHYILLKSEGGNIWFNNPHNNQWLDAGLNSIYGGFEVQNGDWVWTNFGLYITVS